MMAGANVGKAIVVATAGERTHPTLPRGWRAAEALRTILPARLKGALAGVFVTEASLAAAAESMP